MGETKIVGGKKKKKKKRRRKNIKEREGEREIVNKLHGYVNSACYM
jgi:hypothetical protein